MHQISIKLVFVFIVFIFPTVNSEEEAVKQALVRFMYKLSQGNLQRSQSWGWNLTSDPCTDKWEGVRCDMESNSVKTINLENFNLVGDLDAASLCLASSIQVLNLKNNKITGYIQEEIAHCRNLNHLYLRGNQFSGELPGSLTQLSNLRRLDIAYNNFYGELPDLPRISGLLSFLAQNNRLSGKLPEFNFSSLQEFDVSNNSFTGLIPDVKGHFSADSFAGNPELCGKPPLNVCPPPYKEKPKKSTSGQLLIYSGYMIISVVIVIIFTFKFLCTNKPKQQERRDFVNMKEAVNNITNKQGFLSNEFRAENRLDHSPTSFETGEASPFILFSTPDVKELTFEEILQAPANLLGRGKHGSLYKVMIDGGLVLTVKRTKDWGISSDEFERRMTKIRQVKHPNVLPPVGFYCSSEEKLLIYEYQQNGSLFQLLHGVQKGQAFDWESRLTVAVQIAEALCFMHEKLREDVIAHGNLKSSNILFNKKMKPCISEFGLMVVEHEDPSFASPLDSLTSQDMEESIFRLDVYGFGVILLELLTGKVVQREGFDLASWVQSVVREEWTVDVFDEALITEGSSEERMIELLQVALKCINACVEERASMSEVAVALHSIKEEEAKSISFGT